jgi:uncharacterized membrane protein YkvA (DUF1232 family)
MEAFFGFLKVAIIGLIVLFALFIILLSLPASRLRSFLLETMGWGTAGISAVSVVSPIDFVPDFIPVLGWADDVGMLCAGIASIAMALVMRRQRHRLEAAEERRQLRGI